MKARFWVLAERVSGKVVSYSVLEGDNLADLKLVDRFDAGPDGWEVALHAATEKREELHRRVN